MFGTLLVVGALAASTSVAGAAGVPQDGTMTLDPTEGPAGSTFTVTNDDGSECEQIKGPPVFVRVEAPGTDEGSQDVVPDEGGDWTATFTVAADAEAGSTIPVEAICGYEDLKLQPAAFQGFRGGELPTLIGLFTYAPEDFTVTGGPTTTEGTTTTTEGTTTTTEPPASLPDSETAPDVVQTPTLTG